MQEACTDLLSKEKELLSQLALAKKVSQTADARRGPMAEVGPRSTPFYSLCNKYTTTVRSLRSLPPSSLERV